MPTLLVPQGRERRRQGVRIPAEGGPVRLLMEIGQGLVLDPTIGRLRRLRSLFVAYCAANRPPNHRKLH